MEQVSVRLKLPSRSRLAEIDIVEPPSYQSTTPNPQSAERIAGLHGRHRGLANILWWDGHVTSQRPDMRYLGSLALHPTVQAVVKRESIGMLMPTSATFGQNGQDYYVYPNKRKGTLVP